MAGAVGAGGLGDFAIRYGHDRNQMDVTWVTVIVVFILVSAIQLIGDHLVKKHTY
jgi:D-methionine transport system permease protein